MVETRPSLAPSPVKEVDSPAAKKTDVEQPPVVASPPAQPDSAESKGEAAVDVARLEKAIPEVKPPAVQSELEQTLPEPSPQQSSAALPDSSPNTQAEVKKAEEPVAPTMLQASISFREHGRVLPPDASLSVDDIGSAQWVAVVEGLRAEQRSIQDLSQAFSLSLYDIEASRVVARLKVDPIASVAEREGPLRLTGKFTELRKSDFSAGKYRAMLLYKGELVSAKDLSFHKATVRVGQEEMPAAGPAVGGQTIQIVQGPAYIGPEAKAQVPNSLDVAARDQPPSQDFARYIPPGMPSSGLPPAKGFSARQDAALPPPSVRGQGEPAAAEMLQQQPSREVVGGSAQVTEAAAGWPSAAGGEGVSGTAGAMQYRGMMRTSDAPVGDKSLMLALAFEGENVSGSADVSSLGSFSVSGRVLPHGGWELFLRSSSQSIRLTAVKKSERLYKGRFEIPSQRVMGSWEVTRAQ